MTSPLTAAAMPERPHHRFWPARLPRAITVSATPLADNLITSARRFPDKVAVHFFGRALGM